MAPQKIDRTAAEVSSMDRSQLSRAILDMDCDFPVDFTEKQLRKLSMEKLRHVYLALILHGKDGSRRRRT